MLKTVAEDIVRRSITHSLTHPSLPPPLPPRHVILDEVDEMLKMGFAEDIVRRSITHPLTHPSLPPSLPLRHVILDEADEMLKMGFAEDIEKIFSYFDVTQAQMLLFSATTPSWVQDIARKYLKNPINVDAVGGGNRAATTIRHVAVKVPDSYSARKNVLEDVIAAHSCGGRAMVFTQTKSEADELSTSSPYAAENTRVLHGDITQRQRELTLKQFRYALLPSLPPSLPPTLLFNHKVLTLPSLPPFLPHSLLLITGTVSSRSSSPPTSPPAASTFRTYPLPPSLPPSLSVLPNPPSVF